LEDFDIGISRFKDDVFFGGILEIFSAIFEFFTNFESTSDSGSIVTLE
jgi:hypothetical protein